MSFEASHFLPYHKGKCKNLHGHHYIIEVEVSRSDNILSEGECEGMVIDFGVLKKIIKEEIIDRRDHSHLNNSYLNPTAEILVDDFVHNLQEIFMNESKLIHRLKLIRVRLYETPDSYAEWRCSE